MGWRALLWYLLVRGGAGRRCLGGGCAAESEASGGVLDTIPAKINARLFLVSRARMTRVSSAREPHKACIGSPEPPQLSSL